jgi:polysaccharide pyruvyl transferase WcaK-like protein
VARTLSARSEGATTRTSILILSGDSDGNLGDRAILQAMSQSFRELVPDLRLTVVSGDAERAAQVCGADAIPRGLGGLVALCQAVRRSSLVIVGGGGLFQDDDSLVKMPYWAMRVCLVRLLGRPVVGYALGVGPLDSRMSRAFARLAFSLMRPVTVRDPKAQGVAQAVCAQGVSVVPDPAIGLAPLALSTARAYLLAAGVPVGERPIVGVALRRWFPPGPRLIPNRLAWQLGLANQEDEPESVQYLGLVSHVLDKVVEMHDAFILFMPSYAVAHEGDEAVSRAVLARMKRPVGSILVLDDPQLYKACCGQLAALLAGRMHPMIFASAMGTPIVGLAYNPKFYGFLTMLGQSTSCVDVLELVRTGDAGRLVRLLDAAIRAGRQPIDRAEELARRVRAFDAAVIGMLP